MKSLHSGASSLLWCLAIATLAIVPPLRAAESKAPPRIDVILWFDTEDYLLPADDDAAKRLAEMLTARGIRATFKVVGEKARVLERRGRTDAIDALKKHCIGYHSAFHSVHPTPSEYLAESGFLDGVAEFVRRESAGAADVRRVFGVPTLACYGQPGSSWGSQTIVGLKEIGVAPSGVPCYVDEGSHVGLNEKPFWYAGAINVYHMGGNYTRMELHNPDAVEPAKKKVSAIAARLAGDGGGLISIFYHPCEWVHQTFWDGVNFAHGANPPREEWKPPPQRPPEQTEAAFERFGQYIDHIRAIPGVRWVTAEDLPSIYPDPVHAVKITEGELDAMAGGIAGDAARGLDFRVIGGKAFSIADQFEAMTLAVTQWIQPGRNPGKLKNGPLGPDSTPPAGRETVSIVWPAFRDAALDVRDFILKEGRIPSRVFIGPDSYPPADFLVGLASVYTFQRKNNRLPLTEGVTLGRDTTIASSKYIAADTPGLFGGWVIHRQGFRAPRILEVARLQAWTLKPAIRAE